MDRIHAVYRSRHQLHSDDLQALQRDLAESHEFLQDLESRQPSSVWRVWISGLGLQCPLLLHLLSALAFCLFGFERHIKIWMFLAYTADGSASPAKLVERVRHGAQPLISDASLATFQQRAWAAASSSRHR